MPAERYYFPEALEIGKRLSLSGAEFHHLLHVMRTKEGDTIELINGMGSFALAFVSEIKKREALVEIRQLQTEKQGPHRIILAQAIPRQNRLDTIIEKSTELGADELWLFPGEKSERKEIQKSQFERLQQVAISAIKQSGRLFLPKILSHPPLRNWQKPELPLLFGDLQSGAPSLISSLPKEPRLIFLTGPESGLSEAEEEILRKLDGQGVKLHPNILRTDTASIAALSIISTLLE